MRSGRGRRGDRDEAFNGTLEIPDLSLVLLVGASGCGKSTFAKNHFLGSEIVSSDQCRGIVSDDENSQDATNDAFELLRYITRMRLKNAKLVVIDATNVQERSRKELLDLAYEYHVPAVAIVFLLGEEVCHERNTSRPDRQFGPHVVRNQTRDLRRSLPHLFREGFREVYVFRSPDEVAKAHIVRTPLWPDYRDITGSFDIVGDIHGCFDEFTELLNNLGYLIQERESPSLNEVPDLRALALRRDARWRPKAYYDISHPENRGLILLGDLVDRGPLSPDVLKLAMSIVATGKGFCVPGNHDDKLMRKLRGKDVRIAHGLEQTLDQLSNESEDFHREAAEFIDSLVSHLVLDGGKLVVAHAGMKEEMQGRASNRVRDFALYGETTGETDEFGLPVRFNWAAEYRGKARVVYGHTPVPKAEWLNGTINIDTGCVFGGALSALRYPENEIVYVSAHTTYAESAKPFQLSMEPVLSAQHEMDDVLDLADVFGKRIINTRLRGNITIREENASAALEAMSRFAASPKWLVYLPPTMSPTETTQEEGLLEHPAEGFAYFRESGVDRVVCEEKHMGSRAVVVICKDADVARRRFGVSSGEAGCVYTRTGRRFFDNDALELEVLARVRDAISKAGVWEELSTDWMILDCELMPWSAKAQELLTRQYAPVGVSASHSTVAALEILESATRTSEIEEFIGKMKARYEAASLYVESYRRYCWPVTSTDDLKLAPFHILASEKAVHTDKDHVWHMDTLARVCAEDPRLLLATPYRVVTTTDEASVRSGIAWWEELTGRGGEGMVIKPFDFVFEGTRGLVQPAVKCRGREYLRIIYGPEYNLPENLSRLRRRGLGMKRSLALREFALGIEGLERFVRQEPLRRVHECAFAVLAMESEPVDPRL